MRTGAGWDGAYVLSWWARTQSQQVEGALDVAFAGGNSHDWDLAAADLLVHEAGGAMTDLAGRGLTYNRPDLSHGTLLAAGAARHAALVALTREWRGEFG